MKKSLLAVSLLAAFGAASAESSVTFYGVIDASVGQTKTTMKTAAGAVSEVTNTSLVREGRDNGLSGSRFGFKGSEDLGNGLKANFVIEEGLNVRDGSLAQGGPAGESNSGRQTYVGLSGDFGAVTLGRQYTTFYDAIAPVTDRDILPGGSTLITTKTVSNIIRSSGALKYVSPTFSGFQFGTLVASNTSEANNAGTGTKTVNSTGGLSVTYKAGPLVIAAAMNKITSKTTTVPATPVNENTKTDAALGVSYDFTVAKVYFSTWQDKAQVSGVSGAVTTNDTTLTVSVPFGNAYVLAGYGRNKWTDTLSTTPAGANASSKGNNFLLGAGYKLSPRTDVYARYAKTGTADYVTTAGAANGSVKTDSFGLGVRHTF